MEDKRKLYKEDEILVLEFDDGSAFETGIMGVFALNDKQYVALDSLTNNDVFLYEFVRTEDDFELVDIPEEDWEKYLEENTQLSSENRIVLKECMQLLNDEERKIVVLHAVTGFKHREIAKLLELPLSTVLSKYNRAIKKLKTALTKGDYLYGK